MAFDPFIQQILSSRRSFVLATSAGNATIASAQRWSGGTEIYERTCSKYVENVDPSRPLTIDEVSGSWNTTLYTCTIPMLDYSMEAAVSLGLGADDHTITQQTPVTCPSANCRFDDLLSLAMCSRCADVTEFIYTWRGYYDDALTDKWPGDEVTIRVNQTHHALPNGLHLENADRFNEARAPILMTAKSTQLPSTTIKFQNLSTLVMGVTTMQAHHDPATPWKNWSDVRVTAQECALYFCVRKYTSQVVNGTLLEQSIDVADHGCTQC